MTSPVEAGALRVQVGSRVRIREASREVRSVRIRDGADWAHDVVDPASALGEALIGHQVGDEVEVHLAASLPTRRVTIEAIE